MKFPHWTATVKVGMLISVVVTTEIWEIFFMKNVLLNNGNVVALNSAKSSYMSQPNTKEQDLNSSLVDSYLKQLDWQVKEN